MHLPPLQRAVVVAALAGVALLAACGPTRPAAAIAKPTEAPIAAIGTVAQPKPDGPQIEIRGFAFAPNAVTVPVGTTLTWTNKDSEPHTVFTTDKAIASKALDTDNQFAFTFTVSGTYSYHCSLHPYMTATVVVR